jgi:hypothetical protein
MYIDNIPNRMAANGVVYTIIVFRGLALLKQELQGKYPAMVGSGEMNMLKAALLSPSAIRLMDDTGKPVPPPLPAVSKVAVGIGAVGIAALFVGLGYWVILASFLGKEPVSSEIGWYFLSGGALLFPYVLDRLSKIFGAGE